MDHRTDQIHRRFQNPRVLKQRPTPQPANSVLMVTASTSQNHPQRWLGPRATTYSEERRRESGFSRAGRADPAGAPRRIPPPAGTLKQLLIIMLLLMAGIEANPGPRKLPQWPCGVCTQDAPHTCIQCIDCLTWTHFACAQLDPNNLPHTWTCKDCTAQASAPTDSALKILQFNCNGTRGKLDEITHDMKTKNCRVAALQETFLTAKSNLKCDPDFKLIRKDRMKNKGGGVAFLVHHSLQYRNLDCTVSDEHTEAQGIAAIKGDEKVHLYNVYIPPVSSCSSGFRPQLDELFDSRHAIIMGDFNAHHSTWRSALAEDTRGQLLADTLDSKTCVVLNGDEPTRAASNGTLSSPDITIASASLATSANWSTETALNSDHKPIIMELQIQEPTVNSERRKYVNFAKADWDGFKSFMEDSIQNLPQGDLLQSERAFRNKMQKAARKFIPNGRIPTVQPGFPTAAAKLADERNKLRAQNPTAPQINEMNKKIRHLVEEHRREKWRASGKMRPKKRGQASLEHDQDALWQCEEDRITGHHLREASI